MIFKQLFEETSSSYTYLLACEETKQAVLIDPVLETVERDLAIIAEHDLTLRATIETHIHADHITGATKLNALTDCQMAGPAMDDLPCRQINLREGEGFRFGNLELHPLHTPGHTATHHAYLISVSQSNQLVLSGDCLLIEGCGRTDFQEGDARQLYATVHEKLFTLSDDTLVYPGHDYAGRHVSSIAQERERNPRLGQGKTLKEFVEIMHKLDLPYPQKMEFAVPGNQLCGRCPDNLPPGMQRLCEVHDQG